MCPAGLPYQRCQYLKNIQMILDACWDDYGFSVYLENVFSLYWFAEPSRFREYGYLSSDIDFFSHFDRFVKESVSKLRNSSRKIYLE